MGILSLRGSKKNPCRLTWIFYDPWGNRTPVYAVRGRRLSRLTNRPFPLASVLYHISKGNAIVFLKKVEKFYRQNFPPPPEWDRPEEPEKVLDRPDLLPELLSEGLALFVVRL